jgi:uncharacterized protein
MLKCLYIGFSFITLFPITLFAQESPSTFRVLGLFTAKSDQAHISFVTEANHWFLKMSELYHFKYDSTRDWSKLNKDSLSKYQVLIFLDSRPELKEERDAFRIFMENGGAWMGFHFSAFSLTPSEYPQNWDWYHLQFLGSGQYISNTWRPTKAVLKIEDSLHPVTKGLPLHLTAAPNEWYRWQNDLRNNPDIQILASIDSSSFPLGTGPKPEEIWYSGYYPVVWTNRKFRMVYFNMGHDDIDYEHTGHNKLSSSFGSQDQARMILQGLLWLGGRKVP